MEYFGGPKISQWEGVIEKGFQRRIRITQNSERQLRTLIMASADREREKIQSSQKSMKMKLS